MLDRIYGVRNIGISKLKPNIYYYESIFLYKGNLTIDFNYLNKELEKVKGYLKRIKKLKILL